MKTTKTQSSPATTVSAIVCAALLSTVCIAGAVAPAQASTIAARSIA